MKGILFVLFLPVCAVLFPASLTAQYYTSQNKVWAFGVNAGLNFNSGSPVAITTGINTGEGCASVSDSTGHLLFYSNGKIVYNSIHAVMPSGANIVSFNTGSTEQAALITPVIGNSYQYYLFSLEQVGVGIGDCNLAYSIVDMTLDGGLGDVMSSFTGVPLADSLGENMIAIAGNHNDIWLVAHKKDTSIFVVYNISSSGITGPVLSSVGTFNGQGCYAFSMLKASANRRKIAQAIYKANDYFGNEVYDFDPNSGIISNEILLDTIENDYGLEFSPDNTKLYFGSNNSGRIIQYDISLSTISGIKNSRAAVVNSTGLDDDLKLGPDGKIYFASSDYAHMDCISFPNLAGAACGYTPNAVELMPGTEASVGLPNLFVTTDTVNTVGIKQLENNSTIYLYPNPAHDKITIQASYPITAVSITDLVGQTVAAPLLQHGGALQVNVAGLEGGVYFVKINGTEVRRFVKE